MSYQDLMKEKKCCFQEASLLGDIKDRHGHGWWGTSPSRNLSRDLAKQLGERSLVTSLFLFPATRDFFFF